MLIENPSLLSDIRRSKHFGVTLPLVGPSVYEWKPEALGVSWMAKFNIILISLYTVYSISHAFRIEILDLVRS